MTLLDLLHNVPTLTLTQRDGGPDLIYDHQMCMDAEKQMLYVFGGRTVHPDADQHNYSGLYRYNANANSWKLLRYVQASSCGIVF